MPQISGLTFFNSMIQFKRPIRTERKAMINKQLGNRLISLTRNGVFAASISTILPFALGMSAIAKENQPPKFTDHRKLPIPTIGSNLVSDPIAAAINSVARPASKISRSAPIKIAAATANKLKPSDLGKWPEIVPIKGTLKQGLEALYDGKVERALAIHAGMAADILDRKILAWTVALSGKSGVPAITILDVMTSLSDWPGQHYMEIYLERAIARENRQSADIIRILGRRELKSIEGAAELTDAYLKTGNRELAHATLAPFWWQERLSKNEEKSILRRFGDLLTRDDHRKRMHTQFYNDRWREGRRMGALAEQYSLSLAREAVVRRSGNAGKLVEKVAPESQKDAGYLFTRIAYARKTDQHELAASLLKSAPTDPTVLVDPDEWWTERRIVSRAMLDRGKPQLAYELAANHSAQSAGAIADAEFHAGWYALRYLNNSSLARKHFQKLIEVSSMPISLSRGYYWLGRSHSGEERKRYYKKAAQYGTAYYGQLAAQALGTPKLNIVKPEPTSREQQRFDSREQVIAIKRLEALGFDDRARILYRHLAETLSSPGELAILSARAEKRGDMPLALQVGKMAHYRGIAVDTLSWPVGAIPTSARIGKSGLALAYAIARQESAFNKSAVSPANARGLLQLLPGTAKQMARETGLGYSYKKLTVDAAYNATLGAAYLDKQLENFGNSYILTFAGYNAGPRRAMEWIEQYGDPRGKPLDFVIDWIERIPFTETRNYVQRIMENYQVYKARLSGAPLDIEDDLRFGRR
jgi:soluble lytic murein transglycosylase